jgi:hypothetical protein
MGYVRGKLVLCAALLGACKTPPMAGDDAPAGDAGVDADDGPDAIEGAACSASITTAELPLTYQGDLAGAGADLDSPLSCDVVDAPFGVSSAGADMVVALDDLVVGTEYVVRLSSPDDLGFYVVTGCSVDGDPGASECLLFVDAQTPEIESPELGRFVAAASTVYVVVDYYEAGEPVDGAFTLEVYAAECEDEGECGGDTPHCRDGRCVGCSSDFDCDDPDLPVCDEPTHACVPGENQCIADDGDENEDDGPVGAPQLIPGIDATGAICNAPEGERDWMRFRVDQPGEHWLVILDWSDAVDLDLEIYDAGGRLMGMSFYEQPEAVELSYLPAGDYYVAIDSYALSNPTLARPYVVSALRATGDACTGADDCALEYRNQIFRGACVAGACQRIEGNGQLDEGDRCDSVSDCAAGTACSSFYFTADADTRMACGRFCDSHADCAPLGADHICATWVETPFCVQRCEIDDHCAALPWAGFPPSGPWYRYQCNVTTGVCE